MRAGDVVDGGPLGQQDLEHPGLERRLGGVPPPHPGAVGEHEGDLADRLPLYVSNGAGLWSGYPLRLGVPAEIELITLQRGQATVMPEI